VDQGARWRPHFIAAGYAHAQLPLAIGIPVTIGLGDATNLDSIEILWPGGSTQKINPPAIDRLTVITEAQ
jgi:hypothetical protein